MSDMQITSGTQAAQVYQKLLEQQQGNTGFSLSDVLEEGGGLKILFNYLQDINKPALIPPKEDGGEGVEKGIEPPVIKQTFEDAMMDSLSEALLTVLDNNPELTESDLDQLFNHILLGTPLDPKLQQALNQLNDAVIENIAEGWELTEDQQKSIKKGKYNNLLPSFTKSYKKDIQDDLIAATDNETQKIIDKYAAYLKEQGYSDDEIDEKKKSLENRLYLARTGFSDFSEEDLQEIPGLGGKNIIDLWNDISLAAQNQVASVWSLDPQSTQAIFSNIQFTKFTAEITVEKDNLVEGKIQEYGLDNNLSEQEIKLMTYLYYNRGVSYLGEGGVKNFPDITEERFNELLATVNKLDAASLKELGLPAGFKPDPATAIFNAKIDAEFQRLFYNNLKTQKPALTDQQIKDIINALKDPNWASNAPEELVAIINKVIGQTSAQISKEFSVPASWAPSSEALQSMANISNTTLTSWGVINQIEDFLNVYGAMVQDMPDSDEKATILNVMAIISKFLTQLKEMIALMQITDSDIANKFSELQLDILLAKQAEQKKIKEKIQKQMDEIKEKQAKWDWIPDWVKTDWFKYLMLAISVVLAAATGGALAALIILTLAVFAIVAEKTGDQNYNPATWLNKIGEAGVKLVENIAGSNMSEETKEKIEKQVELYTIEIIAMAITVITLNPVGGFLVFSELLFTYSGLIQEKLQQFFPDLDPMWVEFITMAAQFVFELPLMIIEMIVTGGAAFGAEVAKVLARFYADLAKIMSWLAKMIKKLFQIIRRVIAMLQKTIGKAVLKTLNKTAPKYAKVVAKIARKSETKITELSKFEKRIVKFFEDLAEKYSEKSTKATKLAKKMEDTTKEIEQENWDFLKEADDLVDVTGDVAEEGLEIGAKGAQKSVPKIKGYERKIGVRTSNLKKSTEFKKMLDEDKVMKELYKKTEFSPSSAVMVAEGTAGVAQAAPQIAANYVKMVVNRIKADMALLEGRLGELDEETKALINIIKKFIAQLMELILGMGDWIQDVGKQQGKLWQDRSRVLSQIVSQA